MRQTRQSVSRFASFGHAFRGIARLLATQPNARFHAVAAALVVVLGVWLGISPIEWAAICLTLGGVIAAEAMNTAVEWVVDLASPDWHALARDAKDVAAGAVLIASLTALAVGCFIFIPKLLHLL